jgi:hypothetical protein
VTDRRLRVRSSITPYDRWRVTTVTCAGFVPRARLHARGDVAGGRSIATWLDSALPAKERSSLRVRRVRAQWRGSRPLIPFVHRPCHMTRVIDVSDDVVSSCTARQLLLRTTRTASTRTGISARCRRLRWPTPSAPSRYKDFVESGWTESRTRAGFTEPSPRAKCAECRAHDVAHDAEQLRALGIDDGDRADAVLQHHLRRAERASRVYSAR